MGRALRWLGRASVVTLAVVGLARAALHLAIAPAAASAFGGHPGVGTALDALFYAATAGLFAAGIAAVVDAIRTQSARSTRSGVRSRRIHAMGLRVWRPEDHPEPSSHHRNRPEPVEGAE